MVNKEENKDKIYDNAQVHEVLTFFMSGNLFGIWPDDLLEIDEEYDYVPVPNSPDFIKGIINSHGRVVTVIDFTKILKNLNLALGAQRRIVILNDEKYMLGLLVPSDLHISIFQGKKEEIEQFDKIPFFKKYLLGSGEDSVRIDILSKDYICEYLKDYFKKRSIAEL